jgi:hypothetical protein
VEEEARTIEMEIHVGITKPKISTKPLVVV